MPNPPVEGSDVLITQIAVNLKPILSMRFEEKHTIEDLKKAVADAVLRVPEKFKRVEKVREAHRKKKKNEDTAVVPGLPDPTADQRGDAAVHTAVGAQRPGTSS
jgi:hypothetical protein